MITLNEAVATKKYQDRFKIFGDPEIFAEIFRLYWRKEYPLATARAASYLDGSMGDALHIITAGNKVIPKKVRLILSAPELLQILPESTVNFFFKTQKSSY